MPIRSQWSLAREGITLDTLLRLVSLTALNPALTIPLLLLARYTATGQVFGREHGALVRGLRALAGVGAAYRVNGWLNGVVGNNFTRDEYVWEKEVVVVTGGSDGIGKLVVGLLAEKGVRVAVMDVQEPTYELQPTVSYFACDLSSRSAIAKTAASIRAALGNPTVLINNAGVARGKTILETTEQDINLTFKVNTLAHFFLTQEFLPSMAERNHGMVVTVASIAGYITASKMVDYAASKAAAITFHEGLTAELVSHYHAPKVRTVLMCQGYTRTALFEGFGGSGLYAETVAEEIVKAVLGGKSQHMMLPEATWGIAPRLRGWPVWFQTATRNRLDMMKGWKGRQVVQPSMEGEKRVEESAVLVGEE